ncbi:tartrate dehydrogenase [Nakamurella flavida]|uniref:D-malate dehydrogenase (decarboxylating) n=1 Tax=Nakamurella flavida TaxID=363630 RepID=A0A939C4W5_9ACTN|nr:tartrate dehydrogenase [Nakamurella flavida]MBM9476159.1 tartrate dehydrogenase [Nakamurella flavida]MDP9777096.1 tartrate dehydrogenase/decarboxylase/D-malate dehydrogenase [Nakamurella flavida]
MRIAVIPGDGIGQEVVPAAIACIDAALARHDSRVDWVHHDWGSDLYQRTGGMMPADGIEVLSRHDAIFLGAVGMPGIPDTETLWGLLIPIRREFRQYVNLRPVRALAGVPSPVAGGDGIDIVLVRENNEGEYSEVGGRTYRGRAEEEAIQVNVFTRHGIERVARYAVAQARRRRGLLTSATKSNGIIHSMPFWDEVVAEVAAGTPEVRLESILIDALAARLVLDPGRFDVIVASNLFGDILSDLAGAIAGSIGVAPSANLNPEREYPSLFEPVHGSAPDIAGRGIANPVGAIWSGAMMLEHLGHVEAADDLTAAFRRVTADGVRTADLGGTATTSEVSAAVVAQLTA